MPLSGVFHPVEALPGVLQPVARALPTTHAFAAGAGVLFLTSMLATFRRRGYITRYT